MNFQLRTAVKPSESDLIPLFGCKFVPFHEILQSNGDLPFLVDVIGVLTGISSEKEYDKDGKSIKMIVIELEAERLKIEVALFGDFVDEATKFISDGDSQIGIVVIQYAKVKTFRGSFFNPDVPQAETLKKSVHFQSDDNSQSVSLIPDSQNYSIEDDFLKSTPRKSIEELKDCKKDGFYIVLATVKGLNEGQSWWYTACKCNKAVSPDSGMYYCERCFCHVVNVVPRYRIKVKVIDEIDSATFVIWDRDGCNLLGKTCSELIENSQKNVELSGGPQEFAEHLIENEFLFNIGLKSAVRNHFEPFFKVNRICNDDSIISKFKASNPSFIASEPDCTVGLALGEASSNTDFQDVESSFRKDFVTHLSDDSSLASQPDINGSTDATPTKMMVCDFSSSQDGDLLSNKLKK